MHTHHRLIFENARQMSALPAESVHLVVTSPPYPMIAMWDDVYAGLNPAIREALQAGDGPGAFDLMHRELRPVWAGAYRVLIPGGLLCVNIGDATRKVDGEFFLYPSHARIIETCRELGFRNLPNILWRKQTNAPNKFMGSGMLPAGAYVTLEHEYILVFRKAGPRRFDTPEARQNRRESAIFWEERNRWFSDVWTDLKGTGQGLGDPSVRERSGAFPFELAYRLILMYSVTDDTVLDPFLGTGTTTLAAMAARRHSVGFELDAGLRDVIAGQFQNSPDILNNRIRDRIRQHQRFLKEYAGSGKHPKHRNDSLDVACISRQETALRLWELTGIRATSPDEYRADYRETRSADTGNGD